MEEDTLMNSGNNPESINPYIRILDETNQMIQISNRHTFEILYANKPALAFALHSGEPHLGQKCYAYMRGLDKPCPTCPLSRMENQNSLMAEISDSYGAYTVKTMLIEWEGQEAFIEYATDITVIRRAQEAYKNEMNKLIASISEAQGVFHLNLTKNQCLSAHGASSFIQDLSHIQKADELICQTKPFVSSEKEQADYFDTFLPEALIRAYDAGKTEISREAEFLMDNGSVHWSRITARLMSNPNTGDLECIFYGIDINEEMKYRNHMELAIRKYERLEKETRKDVLTGVFTKKRFEQLCCEFLSSRSNQPFALIFIDVDYFKQVNDNLGHLMGDFALVDIARKLEMVFSREDIVSRFGGDEFCVLAKNISRENLIRKLDWLLEKLRSVYQNEDNSIELTCSIGAVYVEGDVSPQSAYSLMQCADKALYQAKARGRDRYMILDKNQSRMGWEPSESFGIHRGKQ